MTGRMRHPGRIGRLAVAMIAGAPVVLAAACGAPSSPLPTIAAPSALALGSPTTTTEDPVTSTAPGMPTGDSTVVPPAASSAAPAGPLTTSVPSAPAPSTASSRTPVAAGGARPEAVDTSRPDRVVGNGTPQSCTSDAVVAAVAAGGVITFDCGPAPVTIAMTATAKVVNTAAPRVVLDGGGRVTLSGGGARRILYMNTCDERQGYLTSHCQDQESPALTVQNIAFADGNSTGDVTEGGGGGAIFVRGGQFSVYNAAFVDNACDGSGPDLGGAAIRVLSQYRGRPVPVVGSTFTGGVCSNGGALSSIGVSWDVVDSVFTGNRAVGSGANPARSGTSGGGSGGAIYLDGNTFTLRLAGTRIEGNTANEGGGAVFFVSNDRTGTMRIEDSTLRDNPSEGFETEGLPGIFFLGATAPATPGSTLG